MHRQKLTLNEAKSRFEKDQVQRKRNTETLLFCRGCSPKAKGNQGLLPIREFADNNTWDPEGWYAIVQLGMERMCSQCRESRKPQPQTAPGDQPVGAEEPSVPCAFCTVTKLPKLGFCQKCLATERLACAKCDVGMKLKRKTLAAFSPEEIQRRKRTKELRRARCVKCALVRPNVAKGNVGHCDLCQKSISVSHFHKYDSASKTGTCRRCAQKAAELKRAAAKSVSTVQPAFARSGHAGDVVSEMCLSTVRRLRKSGAVQKRLQPCQASPLLALRNVCRSRVYRVCKETSGSVGRARRSVSAVQA